MLHPGVLRGRTDPARRVRAPDLPNVPILHVSLDQGVDLAFDGLTFQLVQALDLGHDLRSVDQLRHFYWDSVFELFATGLHDDLAFVVRGRHDSLAHPVDLPSKLGGLVHLWRAHGLIEVYGYR